MSNSSNAMVLDNYLGLTKGLSRENKMKLVARLSSDIAEEEVDRTDILDRFFGAFESDKTAEEMIKEIRDSRNFNRQIATFD